MDLKSASDNIHPIRGGRGIQEAQVWEAADALLQDGLRPTIERVRQKIGSGSPNTVSPMLERWFATLGKRLEGQSGGNVADREAQQIPLAIVQAAQQFWDVARREADQVQVQQTEGIRREFELERSDLARRKPICSSAKTPSSRPASRSTRPSPLRARRSRPWRPRCIRSTKSPRAC